MDVCDVPALRLVHEGGSPDVVPHLAAGHGEHEGQGDDAPRGFVVQELQVVATEVQQAANLEIDDCTQYEVLEQLFKIVPCCVRPTGI